MRCCSSGSLLFDLVTSVNEAYVVGAVQSANLILFKLFSNLINGSSGRAMRSSYPARRIVRAGITWLLSGASVESQAPKAELLLPGRMESFVKVDELGAVDHSEGADVGSRLEGCNLSSTN